MVDISDNERISDAKHVEDLLRQQADIVDSINEKKFSSRSQLDRRLDQIEVELGTLAARYGTNHIGFQLPAIIRQKPLPASLE